MAGVGRQCGRALIVALVAASVALVYVRQTLAQADGPLPVSADTGPAGVPSSDDAMALREQTIYIPFDKLERVFEREGRGVFLPYEKFRALWQAARAAVPPPQKKEIPVEALIKEIHSQARAEQDVMVVDATLQIELVKPGWHHIPLRLDNGAIRRATIQDQPARVIPDPRGGYALLYELPAGSSPQTLTLSLQYVARIDKSPGRNQVAIRAPQAPINEWQVVIAESAVKVQIEPALAVTEQPVAEGEPRTLVHAFLGPAEEVRIVWNPRAEGAAGLTALASVEVQQEVRIEETSVHSRAQVVYDVSRGELSDLRLVVPAAFKIVGVFDSNVRNWEATSTERGQLLVVHLFEPARGRQPITLELEHFTKDVPSASLAIPVIEAQDVGRQQGVIAVRLAETLRASIARRVGLVQVDGAELPTGWAGQSWNYAFRYATTPYELVLAVEKLAPRLQVQQYAYAYLTPHEWYLDVLALVQIDRAGLFQLHIEAPSGWQLRSVRGIALEGWEAVAVDQYQPAPMRENMLLVNLSRRAEGRVAVWCEWTKPLDEPNLLVPTGQPASLEVPIPKIHAVGLEQFRGRLLILAAESLRAGGAELTGLQPVAVREGVFPVPDLRRQHAFSSMQEVAAYTYGMEPARLVIHAERRKPHLDVRQLVNVRVEPGIARVEAKFFYDIRFSPVKSLRVDIPATLAPRLRNITPGVRDEPLIPAPQDLAEGMVAWSFSGDAEFIGTPVLTLVWDEILPPLEIGQATPIPVANLRPHGTDRSWGQIVVSRSETIHVEPEALPTSIREIDPRHDLMPEADPTSVSRAFEFQGDFQLQLTATRFEPLEVARTAMEAALLRAVITRSRQLDVQALYRMRSMRQRLTVQFPTGMNPHESLDAEPVRINGKPVPLEQGVDGQFHIPLTSVAGGEPFVLELRYTLPLATAAIELPRFPQDAAVSRVYVSVYLPEDRKLLAFHGPWTNEQMWSWTEDRLWPTTYARSDEDIYARDIGDGITVSGNPVSQFVAQGTRCLFSTVRPGAAPSDRLHLITVADRTLYAAVFSIAAALMFGFLFRPLTWKLTAIAVVWALATSALVFSPTAAMQATDVNVQWSIMGVLGVWLLGEITRVVSTIRSSLVRTRLPSAPVPGPTAHVATAEQRPPASTLQDVEQRVSRVLDEWLPTAGRTPSPSSPEVGQPLPSEGSPSAEPVDPHSAQATRPLDMPSAPPATEEGGER